MKKILIFILNFGLFAFSCEDQSSINDLCIFGKIVGEKCNVVAFQLDEKILGATEWTEKDLATGESGSTYSNVIGLINLSEEFRHDGKTLFVTVRKPTNEESIVPCYHDLPVPPSPYYIVLSVSENKCSETKF